MLSASFSNSANLKALDLPKRTAGTRLHAVPKKLNTLDKDWTKKFIGYGYFAEDSEEQNVNIFEKLEKKKVLSSVEKAGLLSLAEKFGLTLGKIEKLGVLSTAEKLGALSILEEALITNPGIILSYSIPCLLGAIAALVLIPSDNIAESIIRLSAAGAFGTGFLVFFVGGFVVGALQEE